MERRRLIPTVTQLPSKIVVNMNVNPNDVDNRLLAGDAQVDFAGTGVQAAARAKILANPTSRPNRDDPLTGFGWFFYINTQVAPFTNLACRQAVEYAANKHHAAERLRRPGRRRRDRQHGRCRRPSPATRSSTCTMRPSKPSGDPAAAKQQLQQCGQPNGFTTGIAYRSDRPTRDAAAPGAAGRRWPRSASRPRCTGYPTRNVLHQLRGRAEVRALAQHRHRLGRLGSRLAGRLRLPQPAGQRGRHRPGREHQHRELNDPAVNNLFTKAEAAITDAAQRNAIWGQIDKQVMKDAVIVPIVYAKALIYRPPTLTNVYVQTYYGDEQLRVTLGLQVDLTESDSERRKQVRVLVPAGPPGRAPAPRTVITFIIRRLIGTSSC